MPQIEFSEAFLQYIWQKRAFNHQKLKTTEGLNLFINSPGLLNKGAGPDFEEGQILLDGIRWHGPIEIHLRSSDWYRHQHQEDPSYHQVILHVVYEHDQEVEVGAGRQLPTLELKGRIPNDLIKRHQEFLSRKAEIPCGKQATILDAVRLKNWLSQLASERLQSKAQEMQRLLEENGNDWAKVFYLQLARSFGLLQNADPMEQLARHLPLNLIAKLQLWQVEALAFGQAGLLEEAFKETYPQKLKQEYRFLQKIYQLQPMHTHAWKWSGMRPSSFPILRIALFIRLVRQQPDLFRQLVEAKEIEALWPLFKIELDGYWLAHYRLDQFAKKLHKKRLTKTLFEKIAINALLPILFAYGRYYGRAELCERALAGLASLAVEQHGVLRAWADLGLQAQNAMEAQGLLQLRKHYCNQKRCLECSIGQQLLARG